MRFFSSIFPIYVFFAYFSCAFLPHLRSGGVTVSPSAPRGLWMGPGLRAALLAGVACHASLAQYPSPLPAETSIFAIGREIFSYAQGEGEVSADTKHIVFKVRGVNRSSPLCTHCTNDGEKHTPKNKHPPLCFRPAARIEAPGASFGGGYHLTPHYGCFLVGVGGLLVRLWTRPPPPACSKSFAAAWGVLVNGPSFCQLWSWSFRGKGCRTFVSCRGVKASWPTEAPCPQRGRQPHLRHRRVVHGAAGAGHAIPSQGLPKSCARGCVSGSMSQAWGLRSASSSLGRAFMVNPPK